MICYVFCLHVESDRFGARFEVSELAKLYFEHGFQTLPDGRRQRLDPQDVGAEYRNATWSHLLKPLCHLICIALLVFTCIQAILIICSCLCCLYVFLLA